MNPVNLEAINERFRIALESAQMVVFEWVIEDDVVRMHGEGLGPSRRMFRDELTSSKALRRLIHPDDAGMLRERLIAALKGHGPEAGELQQIEVRLLDAAGAWIDVELLARVVDRAPNKRARRLVGTLADISARKQAQRQVEHLRDLYSALSATSQAIIRSTDEAQLFAEICRIAVQWGGFRLAWIGTVDAALNIIPAATHGGPTEFLADVIASVDPNSSASHGPAGTALRERQPCIINRVRDEDAEMPWVKAAIQSGFHSVASFPVFKDGAPFGVLGLWSSEPDHFDAAYVALLQEMASDISFAIANFSHDRQRRQMEAALAQSEALQRAVTDAALDCIVSLDEAGLILGFNPAAQATFGIAACDALGARFVDLLVPARTRRDFAEKIESVSRAPGRASHRTRALLLRGENHEFRAEIALTSIGASRGTVSTLHIRDISELERSEQLLQENAVRYRELVERSPEPALVHREGVLLLANAACLRLFGAAGEEQLLSRRISDIVRPDHLAAFNSVDQSTDRVTSSQAAFSEQVWLALDGTERIVEVAGSVLDYAGRPAVQVVLRDITDRKRSEALQAAQNYVLNLIAQGAELQLIMETLTHYVEAHAPRTRCTLTLLDATGTRLSQLTAPSFSEAFRARADGVLLNNDDGVCGVAAFRCEPVIVRDVFHDTLTTGYRDFARQEGIGAVAAWPVMGRKGQLLGTIALYYPHPSSPNSDELGMVAICSDLAGIAIESRLAEDRIRYLAHYDELTGLPNRFLFNQLLEAALLRAKRKGHKLAAFFLDLDRFKNINDTFGHATGDQVLHEIAGRFRSAIRNTDQIARMGGDEFFFLIDEINGPHNVTDVTRRVLAEAARPFFVGAEECQLSASIGVALYPDDGEDAATLLKNSDIAMYRAKALGKNNFQFYSATKNIHTVARLALESRLRRAIENREFTLHYQPRVRLPDGLVTGVEALVRWNHPERGLVSPLEFIPIAEETGLIVALGHQVLGMALADAKRLKTDVATPIRIAVNLSARQLDDPGLVRDITALLAEHGVDATDIELEITETMLIHHPDHAERVIAELHQMGIGISIDDFGTGYSSLTYLKRFPLEAVKIDRSFITELPTDVNDLAIAEAIIAMAHALGLRVVAEGVESVGQVESLKRLGCDEYQGFLYSRAVPYAALVALFNRPIGQSAAGN